MTNASTFPRRNQMQQWIPAERAIYDAVQVVETAGAHPLLTDAVTLLGQAREKVADFVDGVPAQSPPLLPVARDEEIQQLRDAVEWAWAIIANASGGFWERESPEWQKAAARWRDESVPLFAAHKARSVPPLGSDQ